MVLLDNGGRARHEVWMAPPPADLRGLVEHIAVVPYRDQSCDWRIVPDASPHLIGSIVECAEGTEGAEHTERRRGGDGGRDRELRVVLVGPRSHVAIIDLRGRVLTVAVRFRPGALAALVRDSAACFTDRSVAIGDVFPRAAIANLELAPDAPPSLLASEMIRLVRRAARYTHVGPTAEAIARMTRVHGITEAMGIPERTFRDRVQREIGLSPKPVLRIVRLHHALMLARRPGRTWAEIAHQAGYADQAHFTRECGALLGESPSAWSRRSHGESRGGGGSAVSFKTGGRIQP